ncbi:MAG: hypothetical protein E7384_05870 [Ruminococcaceae bacterium]|nr:hypothetical protein [Oscillospiraceae bacterium]
MKSILIKVFSDAKTYFIIVAALMVTVVTAQIYMKVSSREVSYPDSGMAFDTENIREAALQAEEFAKDRGMISLKCTNLGGGGVYVFINNTMKANITSGDLKNLKVRRGDVVIVKGHNLTGSASVTIESAVGNIDTTIVGTSVNVGNLGKYLVRIK